MTNYDRLMNYQDVLIEINVFYILPSLHLRLLSFLITFAFNEAIY